jgi:hypothetical protein
MSIRNSKEGLYISYINYIVIAYKLKNNVIITVSLKCQYDVDSALWHALTLAQAKLRSKKKETH